MTRPRITIQQLEAKLLQINTVLGTPPKPWMTHANGHILPEGGCVFLDNAYNGYSIRQMMESGGEAVVVTSGYFPKREVMLQLEALYKGILLGHQKKPAQVS